MITMMLCALLLQLLWQLLRVEEVLRKKHFSIFFGRAVVLNRLLYFLEERWWMMYWWMWVGDCRMSPEWERGESVGWDCEDTSERSDTAARLCDLLTTHTGISGGREGWREGGRYGGREHRQSRSSILGGEVGVLYRFDSVGEIEGMLGPHVLQNICCLCIL